MPPLLRSQSALCHYCNRPSRAKKKGSRRFQCENCQADNFLDDHGELMDVPPESASSPSYGARRFATALPKGSQEHAPDSTIFCSTCLKNQYLLTETLANYLPSVEDPSYTRYEASYPDFRRGLEERYPPVCTGCEPRAHQQIEQARHTAKSDHLRRMMQRSRQNRISHKWGWRTVIIGIGGLFFWTSFVGQLAWHLVNVLEETDQSDRSMATATRWELVHCLHDCAFQGKIALGCADAFAPLACYAMICGVLSSWWNPYWRTKLQSQCGRLKGLREYYQSSVAVLLMRLGFWVWAPSMPAGNSTGAGQQVKHTFALIMTIVSTTYTLTKITIDSTPLVFWQSRLPPLLPPHQHSHSEARNLNSRKGLFQTPTGRTTTIEQFPIGDLVPEAPPEVWQSPTPPPEDDIDVMEWEPSHTFHTNVQSQTSRVAPPAAPSPFRGALPPKPTNRLLHPQPWLQPTEKKPIGLPPGMFDNRILLKAGGRSEILPPMAEPKFFSQRDRDADTGLERIFDAVFSIDDTPVLPRNIRAQEPDRTLEHRAPKGLDSFVGVNTGSDNPRHYRTKLDFRHAARLSLFIICLVLWYAAREFQLNMHNIEFSIACLVVVASVALALVDSKNSTSLGDIRHSIPSTLVILGSIVLAWRKRGQSGAEIGSLEEQSLFMFLFVCCCWELPRLISQDTYRYTESAESNVSLPPQAGNPSVDRAQVPDAFIGGVGRTKMTKADRAIRQASPPEVLSKERHPYVESKRLEPDLLSPPRPNVSLPPSYQSNFARPRSGSFSSVSSQNSIETSTSVMTAGWQTPTYRGRYFSDLADESPGMGLRTLALDDRAPNYRREQQGTSGL